MTVIMIIASVLFIIVFNRYVDMDIEQKGVTLGTAIKDISIHLKLRMVHVVRHFL